MGLKHVNHNISNVFGQLLSFCFGVIEKYDQTPTKLEIRIMSGNKHHCSLMSSSPITLLKGSLLVGISFFSLYCIYIVLFLWLFWDKKDRKLLENIWSFQCRIPCYLNSSLHLKYLHLTLDTLTWCRYEYPAHHFRPKKYKFLKRLSSPHRTLNSSTWL